MPRSIPALVNPRLLVWARERAGLKTDAAAAKAGIEAGTLLGWEQGHERPTISQVRQLGEVYRRPLAVFFLPEPPKDFDPQREFRRLPGLPADDESPELRLALRTALFRREAARELYERLGEPIPTFQASAQPGEDDEVVAARVRDTLGITWATQVAWPSAYAALNGWRSAVERVGILVFQVGDVPLTEMRGTSISHGPLPVIVVNNADAPYGRVFTLLHEFIHILLFNDGHATSRAESRRSTQDQLLERVSNRFAGAALLPRDEFLAETATYPGALAGDDDALRRFASRVNASPEAILRRLVVLRRVPVSLYRQKRHAWLKRPWFKAPQGTGGPPIEVRVISSIGRPFTSLVLESYQRNAISSADVVDYLGLQLKHLGRLASQLAPEPGTKAVA
jgi:Zn-dependent peptidase ImmA (M78 family)/DNA-binding XRE family transcriptional regulator